MGLASGKLRHRVRLEHYAPQTDTAGDPLRGAKGELLRAWGLAASVWASIEPLSAREFVQSGTQQSAVDTRIGIRFRSDVTATAHRIVKGSTIYNIHGVLPDKDSGLEYLTLPCSAGVGDGS